MSDIDDFPSPLVEKVEQPPGSLLRAENDRLWNLDVGMWARARPRVDA